MEKIYNNVDFDNVKIEQVLTGYIDDKTVDKVHTLQKQIQERSRYRLQGLEGTLGWVNMD